MKELASAHVLAFAPNWLGDAAMCTPALRALRRRFPAATLSVAGRDAVCRLLEGISWIDRLLPVVPQPGLREMLRFARQVRPLRPDLAVVFPHSFRAALLARLTGARRRLGYLRDGRGLLLTDHIPPHRENGVITPIYMAFEYLALVTPLGCEDDGQGLELAADPQECDAVRRRIPGEGPIVAIAPGAAYGPSKRWPADRFAAVADALAREAGARCVLLWGPGEEDTRAAFLDAVQTTVHECHDGHPAIARMKAAVAVSDLLICNDSGPRHVAIALKKPVVCIMGPTSPRYTDSPWEQGRILRVDVDCGPCQKPVCATDHRCMTRIAPSDVVAAALEHLLPRDQQTPGKI